MSIQPFTLSRREFGAAVTAATLLAPSRRFTAARGQDQIASLYDRAIQIVVV